MIALLVGIVAVVATLVDYVIYPHSILRSQNFGFASKTMLVLWCAILVSLLVRTSSHNKMSASRADSSPTKGLTSATRFNQSGAPSQSFLKQRLPVVAGMGITALVYHGTIGTGPLSYGDWGYFGRTLLQRRFFPFPPIWNSQNLGTNNILGAPQNLLVQITAALAKLGVSYSISERLIYFFPAIILLFTFTYILARRLGMSPVAGAVAAVIVSCNTYQISIISGGWLTIALAEAMLPILLLVGTMIDGMRPVTAAIGVAVPLSIALWTAPQFAYLDLIAFVVFVIMFHGRQLFRKGYKHWIQVVPLTMVAIFALQALWVIPTLSGDAAALPHAYQTPGALATFSFQNLTDGMAVLQPAWPTLRAFSEHAAPALSMVVPLTVLFAIYKADSMGRAILPLGLQYLVGAALSTGTIGPFSTINILVFKYLPGGSLFRNPVLYLGIAQLGAALLVGSALTSVMSVTTVAGRNRQLDALCALDPPADNSLLLFHECAEQAQGL